MDTLYQEILVAHFKKELVSQLSPNEITEIIHDTCYQTLQKIKAVIEDDELSDTECFMKIEQIICLLEEIGSDGGNRHDFE